MSLFSLRGELNKSQNITLGFAGFIVSLLIWWAAAEAFSVQKPVVAQANELPSVADTSVSAAQRELMIKQDSANYADAKTFVKIYPILPPPHRVIASFPELSNKDALWSNTFRSVWLNVQGYLWAMFFAVPLGFLIGLIPLVRGLFSKQVDALRYLPLTALTGLFIVWFGIDDKMKIAFLAFGIIVYLLPVVVQRIFEVQDVYLQTAYTLGATNWQTIKTVYLPAVFAKLIDDIRVLTAISWTYIIIAELLNREGGIGALIYQKSRQGQVEKVFAILIVIITIGFLQDRIFAFTDKRLFPHKYYATAPDGLKESQYGIYSILLGVVFATFITSFAPSVASNIELLVPIVIVSALLIIGYGEFKIRKSDVQMIKN